MFQNERSELSNSISQNILDGFKNVHLTGNLASSIETCSEYVLIKAPTYDMPQYFRDKKTNKDKIPALIFTGGSYANELNKEGSTIIDEKGKSKYLGNHENYINTAVRESVNNFLSNHKEAEIVSWKISK